MKCRLATKRCVMKWLKGKFCFLLGLLSLILFKVLTYFPAVVEGLYTNLFYKLIRFIYAYTLFYIPIPLIYIFFLGFFAFIGRHLFRRLKKTNKIKTRWFFLNTIGVLLTIFYWSWGFNYAREKFKSRIDLEISQPTEDFLFQELIEVDSILHSKRRYVSENDTIPLFYAQLPNDYQKQIRLAQNDLIEHLGEPSFPKVRIRSLKPKGSLLRIKTAGVYFPFALEGHIDDGLHPIEKPFVLAHEMGHAHSFTDEGVCNFIGFLTCVNAQDPFIQYSGWLEYQGYLYRTLRRNYPEILKNNNYRRPDFVITDIKAIIETLDQYPNLFPKFRDLFYNSYLKAQGVKAGMKSYSQIIQLAYSYKRAHDTFLLDGD